MDLPRVFLRADGNSEIGLGHISRLTALSEMLAGNFHTCFLLKESAIDLLSQITESVNEIVLIPNFDNYQEEAFYLKNTLLSENNILVTDGYHYDTSYQTEVKNSGCKLVCIDDFAPYHFVADVVINHAVDNVIYSKEHSTKMYIGTDYVLLKKSFLNRAQQKRTLKPEKNAVLVCFGGADTQNITMQAVDKILLKAPGKHINVVTSTANKNIDTLKQRIGSNKNISLYIGLKTDELSAIMESCDTAVTSASTVALEYICVKGNLFLIQTADNQLHIYNMLIEKDCALPFTGFGSNTNFEVFIENQSRLINGRSKNRISEIFKNLSLN